MVFARGGSKTIPNKNLKYIRNNRLIDIALKDLKNSEICDLICISSDSDEILDASKLINAQKIKRPLELSKDNSSEILAWKHAVEYLNLKEEDIILVAPTTSPLRSTLTLKKIINKLKSDNYTDGVLAIKETSIDCSVYSTANAREGIACYSFGSPTSETFTGGPSFSSQEKQSVRTANVKRKVWKGKAIDVGDPYGKVVIKRTIKNPKNKAEKLVGEAYSLSSYKAAQENPNLNPTLVGRTEINPDDGRFRFIAITSEAF